MSRRATVYFEPDLHRALRLRAAGGEQSLSAIVNEAVRRAMAEDADDIAAVHDRAREPVLDFARVVKDMRRRGQL